jgi:hypothetical protein
MVNKRPRIFKILKQHGKYERKHFSMKLIELMDELKNLGIEYSDVPTSVPTSVPTELELVPTELEPVIYKKISINEPDFSDNEDEVDKPKVTKVKVTKPKVTKVKVTKPEVVKIKRINIYGKKDVQKILNGFKDDIMDLLNEYDDIENLSEEDIDNIENSFDNSINIVYDNIDLILEKNNFDKPYIDLIDKKIKQIFDIKEKFILL